MHALIEDLKWRYATKKFDTSKKISDDQLEIIKESLRLVPSSYGLQPLKFIIITSSEIREKLKDASYGQTQVTDASHLIVICANLDVRNTDIDSFIQNTIETRNVAFESVKNFSESMKNSFSKLSLDQKKIWTSKQAYIALGQLLNTCAALRIDATPMEGFEPHKYNQILDLDSKNLSAVLLCPVGFRHKADKNQFKAKVRKRKEDLFQEL